MRKTKARNALHKVYPYFKIISSSAHSLMLFIFRKDAGCCQIISADQDSPEMQTFAKCIGMLHLNILRFSRPDHPGCFSIQCSPCQFLSKSHLARILVKISII